MSKAPPGWYPDVSNPDLQRLWDGDAWTDSTRDGVTGELKQSKWLPDRPVCHGKEVAGLGRRVLSHLLDVMVSFVIQLTLLVSILWDTVAQAITDMRAAYYNSLDASGELLVDVYAASIEQVVASLPFVTFLWVCLLGWFTGGVIEVALISKFGGTVGKLLTGTELVDETTGKRPKIVKIASRWLGLGWASAAAIAAPWAGLIPFFGYFIAWFDPKRRALHDRLGGTVVVVRNPKMPS